MDQRRTDQGSNERYHDLFRGFPTFNHTNWPQENQQLRVANPSGSLISPPLFTFSQEPYSINDVFSRFNLNGDTPVPVPASAPAPYDPFSSYFPQGPQSIPSQFSFNGAINNQNLQNPVLESPMINDPYSMSLEQLQRDIELTEAMLCIRYSQLRSYQGFDGGFNQKGKSCEFVSESSGRYGMSTCYHKKQLRRGYSHNQRSGNGFQLQESDSLKQSNSLLSNRYLMQQQPEFISMEQLKGHVMKMTNDQKGCRFLEKKFEEGKKEDIEMIFSELKEGISELMMNPFGDCLVQKLFEACDEENITEILRSVSRGKYGIVSICLDSNGSRAVQKLLERFTSHHIAWFLSSLGSPGVKILSKDNNGHRIIQNCLRYFSYSDNKYLFYKIASNCVDIATNRHGCCVIQKSLEHSHGETRGCILKGIIDSAVALSQDEYGNYVVQFVLGLKRDHIKEDILKQLEGHFVMLSMQKFSSNVVERLLLDLAPDQSKEIVKEIINSPDVLMVIQSAFGNYVIQSALVVSFKRPFFDAIVKIVELNFLSLHNNPYGRRVISKVNQVTKLRL
ncbi:hypothetical protein GIB67_014680 [Kingdonia uniflora]|uniref:PUM-HD domain-containing protein n=1 Tax=Kingdonia uniflora TaxID=39325 RepID=A0A7J7LY30_9MAGN|nr:hypothetical protein GIB67_014680 [Kingdonia uniflora]